MDKKQLRAKISLLNVKIAEKNKSITSLRQQFEAMNKDLDRMDKERYDLRNERLALRRELNGQRLKNLCFPKLKVPKEVSSFVRSCSGITVCRSVRDFCKTMYFDGNQWIYRVFGVEYVPNKSRKGEKPAGCRQTYYPAKINSVYEVYREYEDGRKFKSWRIYTACFLVSFNVGLESCYKNYDRPRVSDAKWVCKYGDHKIFTCDADPAVPKTLINGLSSSDDPIRYVRMYKKYRLCRHLVSIGQEALAFDGNVLRNLSGKRLMLFKNWWKQSEASPYFFFTPRSYAEIKHYILDNYMSQFDIYLEKRLSDGIDSRLAHYLYRQKEFNETRYKDYIDLLKEAGYQISPSLRFPKDLGAAHDAMVNRKTLQELEIIRIEREQGKKEVPSYPEFFDERFGVLVRPFRNAEDFRSYGVYLAHCYKDIDSYWNDVCDKKAAMYAICNAQTREPLAVATYSFALNKVTQNLGIHGDKVNSDVQFVAADYAANFLAKAS